MKHVVEDSEDGEKAVRIGDGAEVSPTFHVELGGSGTKEIPGICEVVEDARPARDAW
jgi:hypothetical protein